MMNCSQKIWLKYSDFEKKNVSLTFRQVKGFQVEFDISKMVV